MTVFVRGIVKHQAYKGTFITQSTKVRKISGFKTSFHKNHKNGIFFRQQFIWQPFSPNFQRKNYGGNCSRLEAKSLRRTDVMKSSEKQQLKTQTIGHYRFTRSPKKS